MKQTIFRACLLALAGVFASAPAMAQTDGEGAPADAPEAPAETPAEATADPEPEVSDPEPEVSDPEPEVSDGGDADSGAEALGRAAAEPTISEDLEDATEETTTPTETADAGSGGGGDEGDGDATDPAARLAQANPTAGLPWSMPTVWANTITARTLAPGGQQTYNPFYNMTFSFRPRWNFTPALSIGGRLDLDIELTDGGLGTAYANPTNRERQLYLQDIRLDLTYSKGGLPGGIILAPQFVVRLPTSTFSRGETRVLGLNPGLLFLRPTPLLAGFIPGIQINYNYWITQSNVGQPRRSDESTIDELDGTTVVSNTPGAIASATCLTAGPNGPVADGDCGDGGSVTRHQVAATLFATLIPVAKLQISMSYTTIWLKGDDLGNACFGGEGDDDIITPGGEQACVPDRSDTHLRVFSAFGFSIGYDLAPWLTASLSYSTLAIHPDSDGNGIENPIWNENTQLALNFQIRPSALAVTLREQRAAAAEGDGDETAENAILRPAAF